MDLKNQGNAQKSVDLRYLRKILTDSEIDLVAAADWSAAALWSLWASKEAAYKVLQKRSSNIPFTPRRWSVCGEVLQTRIPPEEWDDKKDHAVSGEDVLRFASGRVNIPEQGVVYFRLFLFSSCVHCVASDDPEALSGVIWRIASLPPSRTDGQADLSFPGRQALLRHVSGLLNLSCADMKIVRERQGGELLPPRIFFQGKPLPVDISLSHDGSFIAHAFLISSAV